MPSSKESASLESRLQACREMSANADAVFLPVGGSLHGARADLARLGVGTVIDVAGLVGRRPLPFHVLRMAVDAVAPAASWWRRFAKLPLKPLLASRGHSATVVLDAALMAKTGAMGRRQVSCAVEMLRQAQGEGVIQIVTLHESAALRTATRRSASQQSILRAA